MAYNYLGLTNRVLKALNEVQLTSANFSGATGFHADVKDAINQSIIDIYQSEDMEWPFAWNTYNFTTTVGQREYTKSSLATKIDWDSFAVERNDSLDIPYKKLDILDFEGYRVYQESIDKNALTESYSIPESVVRLPNNNIIITPVPDQAYVITYSGFTFPTALSGDSDTPSLPVEFEQCIVDGALYYAYMFRDNFEQAGLAGRKFRTGMKNLRRIYIPSPEYIRFKP